jgi:hypothetical protein
MAYVRNRLHCVWGTKIRRNITGRKPGKRNMMSISANMASKDFRAKARSQRMIPDTGLKPGVR